MIVNIYTPTYYRFGKTKKAVESIVESVRKSKHDVHLFIGDNNSKEEGMQEWLQSLATLPFVVLFQSNRNIGKAKIINTMHEKTRTCDYFVSIDSDMLDDEHDQYNWIDEMVSMFESKEGKRFALLATEQKANCCHHVKMMPKTLNIDKHTIKHGVYHAIAGGCVMMPNADFIKLGRYQMMDIYTGDDALLMLNVVNKLKKELGIVTTVRLTHMHNEPYEKEYQEWKVERSVSGKNRGMNKGFWD
jgi:hypothetical protein